jgi:hypothetical protein
MNQRTHAWIAIRAIALLSDQGGHKNLVRLLAPHVNRAAIGAWLPDKADTKRGGGQTQHHVLKNMPYAGNDKARFIAKKKTLLHRLGGSPKVRLLLQNDSALSAEWWGTPYKADPPPGQHVANRAMAVGTMLRDLLLVGNPEVDALVPGAVQFLPLLDVNALTRSEQAALYFFMLSHFVADACMPCHCDGRRMMGYDEGLHMEMESHWSRMIGTAFDEKKLNPKCSPSPSSESVMDAARAVDTKVGLVFENSLPEFPANRDIWLEVIDMARASFAVAALIVSPGQFSYSDDSARSSFDKLFEGRDVFLSDMDRAVLQDAVVNTAMAWIHIWKKVSKN